MRGEREPNAASSDAGNAGHACITASTPWRNVWRAHVGQCTRAGDDAEGSGAAVPAGEGHPRHGTFDDITHAARRESVQRPVRPPDAMHGQGVSLLSRSPRFIGPKLPVDTALRNIASYAHLRGVVLTRRFGPMATIAPAALCRILRDAVMLTSDGRRLRAETMVRAIAMRILTAEGEPLVIPQVTLDVLRVFAAAARLAKDASLPGSPHGERARPASGDHERNCSLRR
jgi:hypothetical protein